MNYNIIIIISIFWIIINIIHLLLKFWFKSDYKSLLHLSGVTVNPYKLTLYSTSLNRMFYIFGNCFKRLTNKWYAIGTVISISLIIPSLAIIGNTIYHFIVPHHNDKSNGDNFQSLYPVIPGVNLPLSHFGYYFLSLTLSSIFHEIGHAIAAVREGVRIHGFGVFIMIIIPGAFVDLSTDQVLNLNVWNQLKIFTAGVWHNVALSAFAIILLLSNPYLLSPFYNQYEGSVIAYIDPSSGATGPNGLQYADLVTSANDCPIIDTSTWNRCLLSIQSNSRYGYCVNSDFIEKENTFPLNPKMCCDDDNNRNLCFTQDTDNKNKCLPVRQLLDSSPSICNVTSDCAKIDKTLLCVKPLNYHNGTKLIQFKRKDKPSVLFWGSPVELFQSITVVNYNRQYFWLPIQLIHIYETFLKYLISFSLALAALNVVPCVFLDGQWIINALIELGFRNRISNGHKKIVSTLVISIGTFMLTLCVILGIYKLFITV